MDEGTIIWVECGKSELTEAPEDVGKRFLECDEKDFDWWKGDE